MKEDTKMARKATRTDYGFTMEALNTAATNLIGRFDNDSKSFVKGVYADEAQAAVEAAYTTIAANEKLCGKSGIPTTTDVAKLAYTNFLDLVPNFAEKVEAELPGAGALTDAKLAAFQWDWTGEGDDEKFNEIARLHVAFRHIAKAHITAMKAQKKAAEAEARKEKNAKATEQTGKVTEVTEAGVTAEVVEAAASTTEADQPVDQTELVITAEAEVAATTDKKEKNHKEPIAAGDVTVG